VAFGELNISGAIARNAPKYTRIVEPFGDSGTFALYTKKKKPKEHVVNIEDEVRFNLFLFLQNHSASDKRRLKTFDWVSSPQTFENVLKITATEGADLYYRFFYLSKFGIKSKEEGVEPTYDPLKFGKDHKNIIFTLPVQKVGLKNVTLISEDSVNVINSGNGFYILVPKTPEQMEAVEKKLPLPQDFFYSKKSVDVEQLLESAEDQSLFVSQFAQSSIMMQTMEVRTNFETKNLQLITPLNSDGVMEGDTSNG